jgi:sugar fermentation stimulation protein A
MEKRFSGCSLASFCAKLVLPIALNTGEGNSLLIGMPLRILSIAGATECVFIKRENRFVGLARCGGRDTRVHINNTGKLLDLLFPGAEVLCIEIDSPRTPLRVVGTRVEGDRWTLIDTKLQERVFILSVEGGYIPWLAGYRVVRRDLDLGGLKIDFLLRSLHSGREALVELKSAVYYHPSDRSARYPDTISHRGRRHVEALINSSGYERYLVFIAGHPEAEIFGPSSIDPVLPGLLRRALEAGVLIKAMKIYIEGRSVVLSNPDLPTTLEPPLI